MTATKSQQLQYISKLIAQCKKCNLYETAKNPVPGHGDTESGIVFIGEAPGFHEDQKGLPFVGGSGHLLDKLLLSINLSREKVFICNILKHRPPQNRDPLPEEIKICTPYLKAQLKILKPRIIITLGRFAMNYFFPDKMISQIHGQIKQTTWEGLELTIISVYHPSAALRNGAMLKALQADFITIGKFLKKL
jgi:uracil-DNA glycosylase